MLTLFTVLALLAAVAAVVLAFIFILPEKKRESLGKFGKLLHDTLNFKFLVIEKVLQALYIFATAFVIVYGFLMLFYVQSNPFASINRWYGGYGIMLMLLGPIVIRVIYELMMLAVLLVKNVISINNKLKSQNDEEQKEDVFAIPDLNQYKSEPAAPVSAEAPAAPEVPAAPVVAAPAEAPEVPAAEPSSVCSNCGAVGETGIFCTKCGAKLK